MKMRIVDGRGQMKPDCSMLLLKAFSFLFADIDLKQPSASCEPSHFVPSHRGRHHSDLVLSQPQPDRG